MQPQFLLFAIFIISSSIGAPQFANNPSQNGQGFGYSGSINTANDPFQNRNAGFGNQQIPFDPRANPTMALPNDLNNLVQQALNSFSNINQELQNTMQNQQRTLTSGMGLGAPGVPFMSPSSGLNLGIPSISGLPLISGFPLMPGLPNFNGQSSAGTASLIPNGLLQSAAAFQQNPMIPKIFNSLSPDPQGNNFGVYTSSQNSNFNPNGVPTTYNDATSTANDNGNITSNPA